MSDKLGINAVRGGGGGGGGVAVYDFFPQYMYSSVPL